MIWNLKADNDWNANDLGLQHAIARLMCPWCGATLVDDPDDTRLAEADRPVAPWNELHDDAAWRRLTSTLCIRVGATYTHIDKRSLEWGDIDEEEIEKRERERKPAKARSGMGRL